VSIQLRGLHPEVRERAELVLAWANRFGIRPIVTSGFRSFSQQNALHLRFLAGESRFPANAPGDSAHNFGLAWDSVLPAPLRDRSDFENWYHAVREFYGFNVPHNDLIHAEVPGWRRFKP